MNKTASRFEKHLESRKIPLMELRRKNLTVLLASGLINPYGSTLYLLALGGQNMVWQGRLKA